MKAMVSLLANVGSLGRGAKRASAPRFLRRALLTLPKGTLERLLPRSGLTRADLFRSGPLNARHRNRMAWMLRHFQISPDEATAKAWPELLEAERACVTCRNVGRCRSWIAWGGPPTAPQAFCPNAARFAAMAARLRPA